MRAALDATGPPREVALVEPASIKILGQVRKSPWERFTRLQRTAAKLAHGRGQPKGVFLFTSHEACNEWTASLNRRQR